MNASAVATITMRMKTMTNKLPDFDKSITEKGEHIITAYPKAACKSANVEAWVVLARDESGQRLDWQWIGGRVVIWCEGDYYKAEHFLRLYQPETIEGMKWVADSTSVIPIDYSTR
jgi:hypothetical protein